MGTVPYPLSYQLPILDRDMVMVPIYLLPYFSALLSPFHAVFFQKFGGEMIYDIYIYYIYIYYIYIDVTWRSWRMLASG